jgi:hypothetical protein
MTLNDLQSRLVAELKPTPRLYVLRRLLGGAGAGLAVSLVLVALLMGYRPDMASATHTLMFWWKLIYVLALALVAFWSADRFVRPGGDGGWRRGLWALAPITLALVLAAWQLAGAPALDRMAMVMGRSAGVCPWCILAFAVPPMMGLIWAVRGLAPTRLAQAGAMIGLAGGGLGAAAYALHCTESTAPFLAVWYSAGIAGAAVLGGVLGPFVLRWSDSRFLAAERRRP